MTVTELENKIKELELALATVAAELLRLSSRVISLQEKIDASSPVMYGTKRNWTKDQHKFLLEKYNETTNLDDLVVAVNTEFGPKGFVERSHTAIACQLYKLIEDKSILSSKILSLAEKYFRE